jgi:acyl-CoA thioesterase FadM
MGVAHLVQTSSVSGRVALGDLDNNLHMNNGSYNIAADFGRTDFLLR